MIKIGLTTCCESLGGRIRTYLNQDYLDAVVQAGAVPVMFPVISDLQAIDELLDCVDAVILTGGDDIDPRRYGEEKLPCCGTLCCLRDQMEFALMDKLLQSNKPFLGICRGFEVLNVALGGTLYQDIALQKGKDIFHPQYQTPRDKVHDVCIEPGTELAQIIGDRNIQVNSRHHQGVKTVGNGLTVCAKAPDGLVEGVELKGHGVAVQWHPESLADRYGEARALFTWLVSQVKEAK